MSLETTHAPLVIDIPGLTLTEQDRRRLAHPLVGGLILFGRNWQSRAQLHALCASLHDLRPDLLICVDHEGGRVQRFRTDGFTHLPPMRAIGERWAGRGAALEAAALQACALAHACGYVLGAELRACGVDLSFTPVLDLDHGRSSVIGDRAFSADARRVTVLARCLMHGLLQSGMANCGKHFPGHGHVRADSHTDLPVDRRSLSTLLADDAAPYGWLGACLSSVMPAHVVYPQVDGRPAGFSRRWLREILRGQLGFGGLVFSDDLAMAGARQIDGRTVTPAEAALAALEAGCDMVLLCNQSVGEGRPVDALIEGLERARQSGHWQPDPESERRRRALLPVRSGLDWAALHLEPAYRQAQALLAESGLLAQSRAGRIGADPTQPAPLPIS